ncbi:MAG: M3 family oligoendopeptidase [Nitrospirae bacterium]|nr:M3 family oligoendopeptidase [Nitrospirota bacterium]MCL5238562.1 M3 family oligoendopeptidase [Nitrospirota bacterium]
MIQLSRTKQTVWDLSRLFESDDDPRINEKRKIIEQKSYAFINKWKDRQDYLEDPDVLKQALDEYEVWLRYYAEGGDEGYYFWLRTQQDQNSPELKAKFNKIEEFSRTIQTDIQFFQLRLAKIPEDRQHTFLEYGGLRDYKHFLARIFAESKYLLSEPEERILNLKAPTSYSNWVRMTSGFLAKEEGEVIAENGKKGIKNFSEIISLMDNKDRKVRASAAKTFNKILGRHSEVAEAEMNSILANKKTDDKLRKISRPDLSRHISDDIDSEVVDALLKSVSRRFDIPSRYYTLKATLMGVKRLKYHERNVEYGNIGKKYSYTESIRLIERVFRELDSEFSDILSEFTGNGQFDVYPGKGKGSGAFCAHRLVSQPTYILLNHTNRLNDVLTLAHELGHGVNNELIRKKQNALNFGTPTSTAEVASTFMEDFVLQEILRKADDETRLAIMVKKLNDDVSTIFRQVACYRFEQELHSEFRQKGYLSKAEIGALFRKHMSAYMGDSVEQSAGSESWWIYWSHIRYFFYVYSYAGGLLISKSLQKSVKEAPLFIDKVKDFLSAGLSDSPKNIFRRLGVDITDNGFWNKGLDEIESLLGKTERLAKHLGKIK